MKKFLITALPTFFTACLMLVGCSEKDSSVWNSLKDPETVKQLKQFVAEKEAQAKSAAKADDKNMLPEFKVFFTAAEKGDWLAVSNFFEDFRHRSGDFDHPGPVDEHLRGTQWQAAKEVWGGLCAFSIGEEQYCKTFSKNIIDSIPSGSVYFGGTDPGRFIITAMQKSQPGGNPFFTLTQNALADGTYLEYLRSMYGSMIYIPTAEDSSECFINYSKDATERLGKNQLKPGEDVKMVDGQVQVSGFTSVMEINALLAKIIFDQNTNREFFIEESFPLDWMYPYLEPHGIIFKINRQPLSELSDEVVQRDHEYWCKSLEPKIGGWLTNETSVETVAAFVKKTFSHHDLAGFNGDAQFVQNDYSCKMFSKARCAIAGLYTWRVSHSTNEPEKKRMTSEADFAFRQAWTLCPYSPEAVYRYINLLLEQNRMADALLVAETSASLPQNKDNSQMTQLPAQLQQVEKEHLLKSGH